MSISEKIDLGLHLPLEEALPFFTLLIIIGAAYIIWNINNPPH